VIDFEFHRPASLDDALELLERYGEDARLIAGGTALVLQMKQRFAQPAHLIGLRPLALTDGLNGIEESGGALRIGALCTLRQLEDSPLLRERIPLLADTVSRVATRRIRSMATMGGALVNGDPNQDPPPALIALGATVELTSTNGSRTCPVEELFVDYYETDVRPGEVLTAVNVPVPEADSFGAYLKFLPRTADDYATVSVAAVVSLADDNTCRDARIVLGAAGVTPVRSLAAEDVLRGQVLTDEVIRAAAATVPDAVDPLDDFRGSSEYKREMAEVFVRRALVQALESRPTEGATAR
jgi:carbon-monoxide dehydrogenase medium subunit